MQRAACGPETRRILLDRAARFRAVPGRFCSAVRGAGVSLDSCHYFELLGLRTSPQFRRFGRPDLLWDCTIIPHSSTAARWRGRRHPGPERSSEAETSPLRLKHFPIPDDGHAGIGTPFSPLIRRIIGFEFFAGRFSRTSPPRLRGEAPPACGCETGASRSDAGEIDYRIRRLNRQK